MSKSSSSKILIFIIILVSFIFALSNYVEAIGVAPSEKSYVFDSKEISYNLRIMNDEKFQGTFHVEATGELSKYVTFSKTNINFDAQKADEVINVKLSIPKDADVPPGEYIIRIAVTADQSSSSGVTAFVGVISKLQVTVPGDISFIKIQTYVPNFINGQENSFSVEVINKGIKPATNCFAVIDILTPENAKIMSLVAPRKDVAGTRTEIIVLPWTPNVNNGQYVAKASVVCDDTTSEERKSFMIGSPAVSIVNFVSEDFVLGGINRFDLILQSEWADVIKDVYANVELMKDGTSKGRAKTESGNIGPLEKLSLPVFIDTKGLEPGKYSMYIMLNYLGKEVGEVYAVDVTQNEFKVDRLSGMVTGVGAQSDSEPGTYTLLIFVIIVVVILNIVLVMKLMRRKEEKKKE
jgi:hypothetical protein